MQHDDLCCPLCGSLDIAPFFGDKRRTYLRGVDCKLVFVPERYWLNTEDEKATYDLHKNDAQDQRVDLYDPFYYNDPSVFNKKYDFICATEVVEHLRYPK